MKKITLFLLFNAMVFTAIGQSPSLSFNGTDNVFHWAETTGVLRDSENHTWEMWVKGGTATVGVIYTEGWGGSNYRGQFRVHADGAGKVKIEFRNYAGTYLIAKGSTSTTTVFDGTWHHIAVVGSTTGGNTTTVLYVDGAADATDFGTYLRPTAWDNTDGASLNATVIGQVSRAGSRIDNLGNAGNSYTWYDGEIDEFRCWKRALGGVEIAGNTCVPASTTNLHRHVKFDEGSGSEFNDEVTATTETLDGTTMGTTYTTNSSCATASVEDDMLKGAIAVYPNPSSNVLNIKMVDQSLKVNKVDLIDLSGKLIYTNNNTTPIDVNDFATGIYVLKVQSLEGGELQKKVVIN